MNVLTLIHDAHEGPGTLEEYLKAKSITITPVRLYDGEQLPGDGIGIDGIISMGGPMNACDDNAYPFLRQEADFLSDMIADHLPVLGICLGAQIIARACGAAVIKSPSRELGWSEVSLTESGKSDALFQGLPSALTVFQWHEDTFELPSGSELIARSDACPNQAFRLANAYGLQFHIEVTPSMIAEWFGYSPESYDLLSRMNEIEGAYIRQALGIYRNFVQLMSPGRKQARNSSVSLALSAEVR